MLSESEPYFFTVLVEFRFKAYLNRSIEFKTYARPSC